MLNFLKSIKDLFCNSELNDLKTKQTDEELMELTRTQLIELGASESVKLHKGLVKKEMVRRIQKARV
jgi:hypothetical protein